MSLNSLVATRHWLNVESSTIKKKGFFVFLQIWRLFVRNVLNFVRTSSRLRKENGKNEVGIYGTVPKGLEMRLEELELECLERSQKA